MDRQAVRDVLADLARVRRIFHSEADFQLAFAWQMQVNYPSAQLRLERRVLPKVRLDVECSHHGRRTAFELKYLTRRLQLKLDMEEYSLSNQGAPDTRRYDVIKDIGRIEDVVGAREADNGFVIVLANDATYWRTSHSISSNDVAFRLHQGRNIQGAQRWGERTAPGTKKGREDEIRLTGLYLLEWENFSFVSPDLGGMFRYLLIEVEPTSGPSSGPSLTV